MLIVDTYENITKSNSCEYLKTCVYIMESNNCVKIGYTKDIKQRIKIQSKDEVISICKKILNYIHYCKIFNNIGIKNSIKKFGLNYSDYIRMCYSKSVALPIYKIDEALKLKSVPKFKSIFYKYEDEDERI